MITMFIVHQSPGSHTKSPRLVSEKRMVATCRIPEHLPKAEMKCTGLSSVRQDAGRRIYVIKNPQGPQIYILVVQLRGDCNNQASELGEQ